jgi:hypothetical protein
MNYSRGASGRERCKGFPDLEEDAINAIYDLCKVERNVDVLVQSLQAVNPCLILMVTFLSCPDESGEVAVVKNALIQHLELDSKVVLGVLCDQIVPPDEPMEEEDRAIRERLRGLVVAFLADDAREPLLARL